MTDQPIEPGDEIVTPGEFRAKLAACGCPQDADHTAPGGFTRRRFLGGTAALAGAGMLSGLVGPLTSTQVAFAAPGDTSSDTLVVVSLRGGFDGLNAVVPASDPVYRAARPNVGIPASRLLQLDSTFGLHPALQPLKALYDAGELGFVHAVGQTDPTRSHFAAMEEMERAAPGSSLRTGWIDRMVGAAGSTQHIAATSLGVSQASTAFAGPNPEIAMRSVDDFQLNGAWDERERNRWRSALTAMYAGAPAALAAPARATLGTLATTAAMADAGYTPAGGAVYPDSELGNALRDVARLIKAGVGLRVAAVDCGDWDMHAGQGTVDRGWFTDKLADVAASLVAFRTDLGTGMRDVTLITLSEFGRRLSENGSGGTDHGHGNAVFLMGGGVVGGQVHGRWPTLAKDRLVQGDLAGTTDYRLLLAEILEKRCGVAAGTVFPQVGTSRLGIVRQRSA